MRIIPAIVLACLPISMAAAQQVENITINANTVPGIWRLAYPHYVGKSGLFGDWKWGSARENFCRLEQEGEDIISHCLFAGAGTATVDGNHVHFAWGSMMGRLVIDGEFQSDAGFTGHAAVELAGIRFQDPDVSSGIKINPASRIADKGGKASLLKTIIVDGIGQVSHTEGIQEKQILATSELGSPQAVIYLGQQTKNVGPGKDIPAFFAVYAIEFDNGERICGLHQRDDGSVDALECA